MKRASAIVTNRGGRTCHAAIIARELGIPAVVGTGEATRVLEDGRAVTVSCAEGDTGLHLRRGADVHRRGDRARRDAGDPDEDHDERRHARSRRSPSPSCPTPASAWPGWSSSSTGRSASTPRRCSGSTTSRSRCDIADQQEPIAAYAGPAGVLRPARRRGRLDPRRRVRAGAGDRADERLQVQRVRQPRRRRAVRARRGEPDDRLPRGLAVPLRGVRRLLRDGGRGAALRARRDGPDQRQDHDPVRPHRRRGARASSTCSASTGWSAARTTCRS